MNCKQALDLLMARLGNRTEPMLRANCLLEMVLVQQNTLEGGKTLPWFLVSEDSWTDVNVDLRRVLLPSDFLRELDEDSLLYITDDSGEEHELIKDDYDALVEKWGNDTTSTLPEAYSVVGDYIMLFPIPSVARQIRMRYYRRDEVPTDSASSENQWLKYASDLLIAETGMVVAALHTKDDAAAGAFKVLRDRAYNRFIADNTARTEANRMRSMGDD